MPCFPAGDPRPTVAMLLWTCGTEFGLCPTNSSTSCPDSGFPQGQPEGQPEGFGIRRWRWGSKPNSDTAYLPDLGPVL